MIDITQKKYKLPFFWTLVGLFFVTSSALIMYSFGYIFNSERGIFVHTGSITIKSNPRDIEVEMNGKVSVKGLINRLNNSYHIPMISPNEYMLEVKSPEFQTWFKKINIKSGFSTEFWNVLLVRKNYERTAYSPEGVLNFFISPSKTLIASTKNEDRKFSVFITDTEKNSSNEIFFSEEYQFTDNEEENIEWSPESEFLILPLKKNETKEYFSINIETKNLISISNISSLRDLSNVRWDTEEKNIVYFISTGNLYRMDLNNPKEKRILAENISSYDISGGLVYYFQLPSGLVFQKETIDDSKPVQVTMSSPTEMDDPSYKIIVYDKEKLVLRNNNGKLYIFNTGKKERYFKKLSDNAKGTQFSNDGKKLLFWDTREIYVYYLADWETQPYRSENEAKSVTRYSQQIENVQWNNDYEHVVFSIGNEIKVVELDDRDNRNTFNITQLSTDLTSTKAVMNFSEDKLYFLDKKEESSTQTLQSINFPEKTTLLNL